MSFVAYGAFKKERSFFMKKISGFFKAIGRYFKNFGVAFAKGDIWVKLSAVIMGAGYFARKQIVNGLIMLIVEAAFVLMFLTDPHWAKVMIILINIWVGVPYQMLIATGVLMNIPTDQIESAKIDGATNFQVFWKITMPYILFIQGPALITDFVKNINNFNVIYLLTQDVFVTQNQALANSHAKEVDLLVTWLFRLTNEYYDYKMASVIGIIVFIICAAFTLISFSRMISGDKEEEYQ